MMISNASNSGVNLRQYLTTSKSPTPSHRNPNNQQHSPLKSIMKHSPTK